MVCAASHKALALMMSVVVTINLPVGPILWVSQKENVRTAELRLAAGMRFMFLNLGV